MITSRTTNICKVFRFRKKRVTSQARIYERMSEHLNDIQSPADLRKFDREQLPEICNELRSYMIDCCSRNPGHLASSLGAVEIIAALHYVFHTPYDKIVFDVGHQAYAHKILTGRREQFASMRTAGGISGFPKISESEYDAFGVGHSSTSISAALGLAEASRLKGEGRKVVAVIGDGALTGGLAFEGLNNAGDSDADLLVILNDNNRSIDASRGALHKHLLNITTHPTYNRMKERIWKGMGESGARAFVQRWTRSFKSWIVKGSGGDLFEALGFRYFGPVDGNDIGQMTSILTKLRDMNGPRILHCITTKGKGYAPAEADPTVWHAPGKFEPESGKRIGENKVADKYQDVFGATLIELARKDSRIVGITPAMASGSGMTKFAEMMPERFFDVGIEEEHAVTFAAGLATGGMRPVCSIYSSFSQRAYDQIIHDVALQNLPVVFCFDRAGLVGEDGPTHHGVFDMAAYRSIPNMTIASPMNEAELKSLMYTALTHNGPFIIRYPRGCGEGVEWRSCDNERTLPIGQGECLLHGSTIAILAIGPSVNRAMEAAKELGKKHGKTPSVYNIRYIKPLDETIIEDALQKHDIIMTVEDGCIIGGLFGAVSEFANSHGLNKQIIPEGIPDRFISQGSRNEELKECGIDTDSLLKKMEILLQKN